MGAGKRQHVEASIRTDGRGGRRIGELEAVEFTGADAVFEYTRRARSLGRDLASELALAAEELEAVLHRSGQGHPALMGLDVRIRAKRVTRRLLRAAEAASAVAAESSATAATFRGQFLDQIQVKAPRKKTFDWGEQPE